MTRSWMWKQVQLAVDLARHASACCGELPEVSMEQFIQTQTTAHVPMITNVPCTPVPGMSKSVFSF